MELAQFAIFIITMAALFLWNRSEANQDRRDMMNLIKSIENEMKDFHGRLCNLEGRRK